MKIEIARLSLVCSALSLGACAQDAFEDPETGVVTSALTSGARRAANGNACTAAANDEVTEADCLTMENPWGGAGARAAHERNNDNKLVYTGIDATDDRPLITIERTFAAGFRTTANKANAGVYGAHGAPGWIQGLPNTGANGTILNETFGTDQIPWLALSVCYAGNSGSHASAAQIGDTPKTYKNNMAAATFIKTYFNIPSSAIVGCKNGVARPSGNVIWCLQNRYQRDGAAAPEFLGDASLVEGDGTVRGSATTVARVDDDSGDYSLTLQAAAPTRHYKARNEPTERPQRSRENNAFPAPWNLASRCNCNGRVCNVQDDYPAILNLLPGNVIVRAPGSGGSVFFMAFGRFLTTDVRIEQPDGTFVSVSSASALPGGSQLTFVFTPTQDGPHYIHVRESGLVNVPRDPDFPFEQFLALGFGPGNGSGSGSGSGSDGGSGSGSGSGSDGGSGSGSGSGSDGGSGSGSGSGTGSGGITIVPGTGSGGITIVPPP